MAQISQQADGTYTKTYSDTEIMIMQQLQTEIMNRKNIDDQLYVQILDLDNRVDRLEEDNLSFVELQNAMNVNSLRIEAAEMRLSKLEQTTLLEAYSKQEIDLLMIPWYVEQIERTFDTPTMEMFETVPMKEIVWGFIHYKGGNINEPESLIFGPNTMRRYSISAYVSAPQQVEFSISYADRFVAVLNDEVKEIYQEDGGNFSGTQKLLTLDLESGWNRINFLVANESQKGGLVVSSMMPHQVEKLTAMSSRSGRISGSDLMPGSLMAEHFSPNMKMMLQYMHATTTAEPAGVFGDPETYGAIQIADGIIEKSKGEPFVMHGDLKVLGYVRDKNGDILGGGGGGLSTADREKLDSIEWYAEVNQNAYSFVKFVDLPATDADAFANVINAAMKMDTLRIRGDLGITFAIETVKNEEGAPVEQMVIKNSPTLFKQKVFRTQQWQDTFTIAKTEGAFQLGRGTISVFIEGIKQSYASFTEVDEHTIRLVEKLPENLAVMIEWQEGSPAFAKETIVSLLDIPVATKTQDGLMSRFHVNDLYDHRHKVADLIDLNTFTGLEIDDGETVHKLDATGLQKLKIKAGANVKLEKMNDVLRIGTNGPILNQGRKISITGSAERGYTISNDQRFEVARGLSLDHIEGIDLISGPRLIEGGGIDIQTVDDVTYKFMNNMKLSTKSGGIGITGNAEEGYVLDLKIIGDGIGVETTDNGFHLINKTKIINGGGIGVTGNSSDGWTLYNRLSLQASVRGSVVIGGTAEDGYLVTGLWPAITGSSGIAVDDHGDGTYTVRNEGVTSYNGQTGAVVGVGSLNKVQEGLGIDVRFMGGGDFVVHNTGVIDLIDDGRGIDVSEQANGVFMVKNLGVHRINPGRGITVGGSSNDVTITNDGIVELIEGVGIDVNTNGSGLASIRNTGVLSWNGQTGDVVFELPEPVEPTKATVMAVYPFFEYAEPYHVWMKTDRDSTTHYMYGVKLPGMSHINVTINVGMDSMGQSCKACLYTTSANNVVDEATVSTPRNSMEGEKITLHHDIRNIPDYAITGIHVGLKGVNGTAFARVQRAWMSIGEGSNGDYKI